MEAPNPQKAIQNKENSFNLKDEENNISYTLSFRVESNELIVDISEEFLYHQFITLENLL